MRRRLVPWSQSAFVALSRDSILGKVVREHGPPKLRVYTDPFAALVATIVGQQLSGKAASSIFARLQSHVGEIEPTRLTATKPSDLRSCGLSSAKCETIRGVAQACCNGLDFRRLRRMDDEELRSALLAMKGIGPWTVEMFMMFALGRPDVMSAGDLGLRKGLRNVYQLSDLPRPDECCEMFERWRPWRTAASWYLWRAAEDT